MQKPLHTAASFHKTESDPPVATVSGQSKRQLTDCPILFLFSKRFIKRLADRFQSIHHSAADGVEKWRVIVDYGSLFASLPNNILVNILSDRCLQGPFDLHRCLGGIFHLEFLSSSGGFHAAQIVEFLGNLIVFVLSDKEMHVDAPLLRVQEILHVLGNPCFARILIWR